VKQSANLWDLKALIQGHLAKQMNALDQPVYLVDRFPVQVGKITRSYGSHCFKGEAGWLLCSDIAGLKDTF